MGARMFRASPYFDDDGNPRPEFGVWWNVAYNDRVRRALYYAEPGTYWDDVGYDWAWDCGSMWKEEADYVVRGLNACGVAFALRFLRRDNDGTELDRVVKAFRLAWCAHLLPDRSHDYCIQPARHEMHLCECKLCSDEFVDLYESSHWYGPPL